MTREELFIEVNGRHQATLRRARRYRLFFEISGGILYTLVLIATGAASAQVEGFLRLCGGAVFLGLLIAGWEFYSEAEKALRKWFEMFEEAEEEQFRKEWAALEENWRPG